MDKQSVLILVVALTILVWGGWQTYLTYPQIIDSYIHYAQSLADIDKFKTVAHLFVKIIPVLFLIGGIGMVMLKKWALSLVHTTLFIDLFVNGFRIARAVVYWIKNSADTGVSLGGYFLDRYLLIIYTVFIFEIVLISFTLRLRNELID